MATGTLKSRAAIVAGRRLVDAYRTAHEELHARAWTRGVPESHTELLEKLVAGLEKVGYLASGAVFEERKSEILSAFTSDSDLQNLEDLGFADRADFKQRATQADREALEGGWR